MPRFSCLFIILLLLSFPTQAQSPLVFAVHPYLPALEIKQRFSLLIAYLSRQLQRDITLHIASDYQTHLQNIISNKVDFAFIGPALYVQLTQRFPQYPIYLLAKLQIGDHAYFQGKIVVTMKSPYKTLQDLQNKRFAFGDKNSTMSHLVPRSMLQQAGIQLHIQHFLGSHNNVALAVLLGKYDAGAIKDEVFRLYQARGLRAIATTPKISEHLFIATPRLSQKNRQHLKQSLLNLSHKKYAASILKYIKPHLSALVAVQNSDYDNLRTLLFNN